MSSKEEKYKEALKTISMYVLPFRTIDGKMYVELEFADHLRDVAKEALTLIKEKK